MNSTEFEKLRARLRAEFSAMARHEPRYHEVLRLMEYGAQVHNGLRKDGRTQEFYHQLSIVAILLTQHRSFIDPVAVYLAALSHDLVEDNPEKKAEIQLKFPNVLPFSMRLSKVRDGVEIPYPVYFGEMAQCPVSSVVKLFDRLHNLSTMMGVFTPEKMLKYAQEVSTWFLPMAKAARRNFPEQEAVYELAKSMLIDQCRVIEFFVTPLVEARKALDQAASASPSC
jgi:(p)ppGpp synthase/HD superfamily hydrolase